MTLRRCCIDLLVGLGYTNDRVPSDGDFHRCDECWTVVVRIGRGWVSCSGPVRYDNRADKTALLDAIVEVLGSVGAHVPLDHVAILTAAGRLYEDGRR